MTKTKKIFTMLLIISLISGALTSCGNNVNDTETSSGQTEADPTTGMSSTKGITLKYAQSIFEGGEVVDLVDLVHRETGIKIELVAPLQLPDENIDPVLIMLQAGDEVDIVYGSTAKLKTYYNAGVLIPIDELAAADNYDMQGTYGSSLPVMDDGKAYGLPAFNDIWLTVYNKKVFDDADIAYPPLEDFTWEKYIEIAKQLTDAENDLWGSYMLDYDCYNYMLATQKGAQPYLNGTANFNDPRYKESLEFFYSLGNDEKIQPDAALYASELYSWNQFVTNDNMGMWVIGGWAISMLPNQQDYPREWKAGLAPMPYPKGEAPSTLSITGCYGIPTTCKNPEAAFEVIKCIAENQYTLGYGRIPARTDLTEAEIMTYIEEKLIPVYEFDGITAEEIKACWFDADRLLLPEKIIGVADSQINEIWLEEGQLYGQKYKSAEDAIRSIQQRANRAIENEKATYE
jgi:multiple sugar transport system substrate-binding protein